MKIGRVIGTVVSTINSPVFDNRKLLICDWLGTDGRPSGGYTIAVDAVDAGAGEVVLIIDEGNGARQIVRQDPAPIRAVVVGIVDEMLVDGAVVVTSAT
ncbi:MAG: EutN/CcmL family microcompartment protein [Acidimicrobiia bacterium]|nr:EutN/CcmL family microcompartment protein [Acidimicrobiia bacterium]